MPDQPTDVRRSAALAALVQGLSNKLLLAGEVAQADRGDYEVKLRHGVSRITAGRRRTLGVIFHDAA